jgi:translation initiation factor 3 subunit D
MRWGVQSYLSGANKIKLGFVSRKSPKDNTKHMVLGFLDMSVDDIVGFTNFNPLRG